MSRIRTKLYRAKQSVKRRINHIKYGKCAVLLYHRVSRLTHDPQQLAVSPDNFAAQLDLLKKEYTVLAVSQFEELISSGEKFPDRSVLLTFDDGYADNYLEALPILEEKRVQALFYICTGNIDTAQEFWWDEVELMVLRNEKFPSSFSMHIAGETLSSNSNGEKEKQELYTRLLPLLRGQSVAERNNSMNTLRKLSGNILPRLSHRSMMLEELKKFAASPAVVIGAHTVNHPSLGALNTEEQVEEITTSKKFLEQHLARQIFHFSYPFGNAQDYTYETEKICGQVGFKYVAANYPDMVSGNSSAFSFPRHIVRNWNQDQFRSELHQFFGIQ